MRVTGAVITRRAREMRRDMTPAEKKLWYDYLRKCPWRFRRQSPAGYYILDFFSPSLRIAVEVDGHQHETQEGMEYDQNRNAFLKQLGIRVLRFSNEQVLNSFDSVCQVIFSVCSSQEKHYASTRERWGLPPEN